MSLKECSECGKMFERVGRQLLCSEPCRNAAQIRRQEGYKCLLPRKDIPESVGFRDKSRGYIERLKLEIEVACNRFWSNPNAPVGRPKFDPGAGGFATIGSFGKKAT